MAKLTDGIISINERETAINLNDDAYKTSVVQQYELAQAQIIAATIKHNTIINILHIAKDILILGSAIAGSYLIPYGISYGIKIYNEFSTVLPGGIISLGCALIVTALLFGLYNFYELKPTTKHRLTNKRRCDTCRKEFFYGYRNPYSDHCDLCLQERYNNKKS